MFSRNRRIASETARHAYMCVTLLGMALFAWMAAAGADIALLPNGDGGFDVVDTQNPGPYAASSGLPDDTTLAKAGGPTFNLYYADVEKDTGEGFDDPTEGAMRRARAVEVLEYISGILAISGRTCDVRFARSDMDGSSALNSGGAYFPVDAGFSNGYAFEHIWNNHDMSTTLDDMYITMDFGWPWYSGTGTPASDEYDLSSALIQIFSQGLGLTTLSKSDGASKLSVQVYTVWDSLLETGAGNLLWTGAPPAFQGIASDLTGYAQGVYFTGAKSTVFYEGKPPVYTPTAFDSKRSLGFWKATTGVVMRPTIATASVMREYDTMDRAALYDIGYTSIAMPPVFKEKPHGGWFTVGQPLAMNVRAIGTIGAVSYQWMKDGSQYPGATSASFTVDALTLGHTGRYTCMVTDTVASYESPAAAVRVVEASELPAMGIIGLCLVAAACVLAGALIILRRE